MGLSLQVTVGRLFNKKERTKTEDHKRAELKLYHANTLLQSHSCSAELFHVLMQEFNIVLLM